MLTCNISLFLGSSQGQDLVHSEVSLRQDLLQVNYFAKAAKYFLIRSQLRKRLQSLCHCNGRWPFTISILFILILGSKEVLLSAKTLNLYLFLSITKGHDWLK